MFEAIEIRTALANNEDLCVELNDAVMEAFPNSRVDVEFGKYAMRVQDYDARDFRPVHHYEAAYLRAIMNTVLARRVFEAETRRLAFAS